MSVLRRLVPPVLVAVLLSAALFAAPTEIKLGPLVPKSSTREKGLEPMRAAGEKDTGGAVSLTVYPAGTDDEKTIVQKMRTDVYQAAFLTSVGLADLDSAFNVFAIPFFLESNEEEAAVQKKLTPVMETYLNKHGLHLL